MDLLKTILLYMSMLYISAVQVAPDPATANITPSPMPSPTGIYATATVSSSTPVPTPAITANPAYGTLVLGDRGSEVGEVQRKLQELGYYTYEIDNAYGNQTRRAVEQFQTRNGLTVDGIAGKYTQTILFESADAIAAPTASPAFLPDDTLTPPPMTATVAPTPTSAPAEATDAPTAEATAQPTATPTLTPPPATEEPTAETAAPSTETPEPSQTPAENAAVLLDNYSFEFPGFTQPLTVGDTETVLHPAQLDDILYIPLIEILQNAGNVVVTNTSGSVEETAFAVLTDFYQISYTVSEDGSVSDLVVEKNAKAIPLSNRSAFLLDGVLFLPMEDMASRTGIAFSVDDATGMITVTMPTAGT